VQDNALVETDLRKERVDVEDRSRTRGNTTDDLRDERSR
jgi:hypothetical protein